jgi:hypothetical protein
VLVMAQQEGLRIRQCPAGIILPPPLPPDRDHARRYGPTGWGSVCVYRRRERYC